MTYCIVITLKEVGKKLQKNKKENHSHKLNAFQSTEKNFLISFSMDADTKKELFFLVAKYLKQEFPAIGEEFIKECEQKKKLFPSCVFSTDPSFDGLDSHSLTSQILISGADDFLIKIWKIPELNLISTISCPPTCYY